MPRGLAGRVVVLTRRAEDNAPLAADLRARGADVIELPCVRIDAAADPGELARTLAALSAVDVLVLTSRAGADAVAAAAPGGRIGCAVAAIGPATAARARSLRMDVTFVPTSADSRALARELPLPAGDVVLARSDIADAELPDLLRRRGAFVREIVAYRTVPAAGAEVAALERALGRGPVTVVVASPSAVDALAAAIGPGPLRSASFVAIGARTARAVTERVGVIAVIAEAPDSGALARAISPLEEVVS